jgi:hypothetical protein
MDFESQEQMVHAPGFTTPDINDAPLDEPIEMVSDDSKVIRFPDGSAIVGDNVVNPHEGQIDPNDHDQNLALVLPEMELREIGHSLKLSIEEDIESQEEFFNALAKIIDLLGINIVTEADKDDLPFKGATTINSMALFESTLDLLASAMSSLYPSTGMVDCVVLGEANDHLRDVAYRKKSFFNYYLTQIAKEFKKEGKRALFWAILGGSCYKKVYIDPVLSRPTSMFIRPEDFIVNREYSTHLTASRKTHILRMDEREFLLRKISGTYRDIEIMTQDSYREDNTIQEQLNQVSGNNYEYDANNEDNYCIYECHIDYYLKSDPLGPGFDLPMPYIISIDEKSNRVLSIRRNWDKGDFLKKKKEYFVNFSLLPSLDGEGYGLVNYAGRLAEAATSITRQLINAGTYANFPGGVYQAGIRLENNNLRPAPGEFIPIQTGGIPVSQAIEALPYKEPSGALKELLVGIEDNIRRPSAIINQKVAEMTPRAPMGSVLAMLESMQKVPNAILQGFHESFQQELMLFNDRFAEWLPEGKPYPFMVPGGDHVIMKEDFEANIQVIPASDPSLQNSTYRFMQSEIVLNQARQGADIHNMKFAYEYFYKNMGLSPDDIKELLPAPKEENKAVPLDPITENQNIMIGKPVTAGIAQDHDSHIMVHSLILNNSQSAPEQKAAAQAHIQEHEALKFLIEMQTKIGFEMPEDPTQIPLEIQNQISIAAAQVAQQKLEEQKAQEQPPEPPIDPAKVQLEDVRRMAAADEQRAEFDWKKLAFEEEKFRINANLEEQKLQQKAQVDQLKSELDNKKIELDMVLKEKDLAIKELAELQHLQQQAPQPLA